MPAGGTAGDALRNSIDLAQVAERAGYPRYWVAEHHLVRASPRRRTPVLVALIAAATSRIRVGSGAVQLPNTPPLQVAEQFGTVAALHPGRIDLGLGRFDLHKMPAAGRNGAAARAMSRRPAARPGGGRAADPAAGPVPRGPVDVRAPRAAARGSRRTTRPPDYDDAGRRDPRLPRRRAPGARTGSRCTVPAAEGADLDVWVLGSSPGESAQVAGARGLPFAASYHTVPELGAGDGRRLPRRVPAVGAADGAVRGGLGGRRRRRDRTSGPRSWPRRTRSGCSTSAPASAPGPMSRRREARARVWTAAERAIVADRVDTQFVGSPPPSSSGWPRSPASPGPTSCWSPRSPPSTPTGCAAQLLAEPGRNRERTRAQADPLRPSPRAAAAVCPVRAKPLRSSGRGAT